MRIKLIFSKVVLYLASFLKWEFMELGNGLFRRGWPRGNAGQWLRNYGTRVLWGSPVISWVTRFCTAHVSEQFCVFAITKPYFGCVLPRPSLLSLYIRYKYVLLTLWVVAAHLTKRLGNRAKILVHGPHMCTKIWVRAIIGLFKMPFHVDLPIKVKGNSKCSSSNSFSPLGAQNKGIGAASQTLLTEAKLHLRRRLLVWWRKRGQPYLHQLHVKGFHGGHSLRLAFRMCFPSFHSSLFIFHWYISMIGGLFQWRGGSWLEGVGLPAMGA